MPAPQGISVKSGWLAPPLPLIRRHERAPRVRLHSAAPGNSRGAMELSLIAAALLGLLLAGWTFAAAALILGARDRARQARGARAAARRLGKMVEHSPAIPLLVKGDGSIEGPERLAAWLGLERLPGFLSELRSGEGGLSDHDLNQLHEAVRRTQRTAAPFHMHVTLGGSHRSLALWGQYADQLVAPRGSALVWWFDFTEAYEELTSLRSEADRAQGDVAALMGLIEAAPMPMWVRGADLQLRLVNRAYVDAVSADDSPAVLGGQIELVEAVEGRTAADFAGGARDRSEPLERIVHATIGGQRRSLHARDLPLGQGEVAGFAIDVEDQEAQNRALDALREAQRKMFDLLSAGAAQFDYDRRLAFANRPFQHLFALPAVGTGETIDFRNFLDRARDKGRLPESGDFPTWRQNMSAWFGREDPVEEAWSLSDGTHLRVVGLPMPDGGLVLIAEDRSEQFALSATHDTLLRTRAAILDSLVEALAIFSPDGRLQSWNRRFPELWDLPADYLDGQSRAEELLGRISQQIEPVEGGASIGEIVRAATLDRQRRSNRVRMAGGRTLELTGLPLPDGNGLLVAREIGDRDFAEAVAHEGEREQDSVDGDAAAPPATSQGEAPGAETCTPLDPASLVLEDIELLPFVIAIVREREAAIEAQDITLNLRGDRRSGSVKADREHLARAIGILVDGSISASPAGEKIEIELPPRGEHTRLAISDNAPGLDKSGASGERPDVEIARRLIEAHGGQLDMQSASESGTTATITLP